jgi:hypothetical protein
MVWLGLAAADPTRQDEKGFIDIFLAHHLPVVVSYTTVPVAMGREEAFRLKVEMMHPTKKPMEIEFYRPKTSEHEFTIGCMAFVIVKSSILS